VATGEPTTTRMIADGLIAALGAKPTIDTGPRREGDLERSVLEPSIGDVVPLADGLARTARWFAEQAEE
jgi:nucleoside-diphosphate-sugar epimerase